uniref:Uncharacterized protein n=2 Tax=Dunaliella tertiolecta TaxID=3047 RepID=A0A6S8J0R5_DUNTE
MWCALREKEHGVQARQLSQACSKNLLGKLKKERELEGHRGCTNTVSFNEDGNVLLSGSDDLSIRFWSWQTGRELHKIHPGHRNNIFQAYALPHSNNNTIVSCAADGQVRVCNLATSGGVRSCHSMKVGSHAGRAHKLSLLPENPASTFLSTGEDGVVMYFDLRAKCGPVQQLIVSEGRRRPPVELNAVHANPARPWLFAVGGGDPYARIFDVRRMLASESTGTVPCPVTKLCPNHLRVKMSEPVHITCVRYNCFGELLATYNDEDIYLFSAAGSGGQQHPIASNTQGGHGHNEPKEEAEGGDGDEDCRATGAQASSSPHAGAGSRGGGGGGEGHCSTSCQQGGCQREDYVQQKFSGHRNSQTVKGVNFFGASDEYVISGSDCGHIFIWQKRDGELKKLLRGDAWVVNCLEPHPWQPLVLATSGGGFNGW